MEKRDWEKVKGEYVTGRESLKTLAERHDIPLRTIKEKSSKEKWTEKRKKFRTETAQKVYQKTAQKEAKRLEKLQGVAEELAALIELDVERLKEAHGKRKNITEDDVKMIKDFTIALKNIADVMRDVYAIPTIREKLLLEKFEEYRKSLKDMEKEESGIIILPPIAEKEEEEHGEEGAMEAAAQADSISFPS